MKRVEVRRLTSYGKFVFERQNLVLVSLISGASGELFVKFISAAISSTRKTSTINVYI